MEELPMRKNAGEEARNYRAMYGWFRSNDDNTPRRKEFTGESGGIINRRAVTPFILTARNRPIDSHLVLGSFHHNNKSLLREHENVLPSMFKSVIECGF